MYGRMLSKLVYLILTATVFVLIQCTSVNNELDEAYAPAPDGNSTFHVSFRSLQEGQLARRSEIYLTEQGFETTDRSLAVVFHIRDQRLTSNGFFISADTNDTYIPFAIQDTLKAISTAWTPAFFPMWSNAAFAGDHKATYCRGSDHRIYIVLRSPPEICTQEVYASTYPIISATSTSPSSISSTISISSNTTSSPSSTISTSSDSISSPSSTISTSSGSMSSPSSTISISSNTTSSSGSTISTRSNTTSSSGSTISTRSNTTSSSSSMMSISINSTSSPSSTISISSNTTSSPSSTISISMNSTSFPSSIITTSSNSTTSSGSLISTITSSSASSSSIPTATLSSSVDQVAEATSIIESSSYQSFCSDYLGYTTPVTTSTAIQNATINAQTTQTSGVLTTSVNSTYTATETVPETTETDVTTPVTYTTTTTTTLVAVTTRVPKRKRDTPQLQEPCECEKRKAKRAVSTSGSVSIPAALSTFAPSILSSACSLEATSVTATSTVTITATQNQTAYSTATVPSSTDTIVFNLTQTTTVSSGTSTTISTAQTSTSTVTDTATSTTTITEASSAPTGALTYLSIQPDPNVSPAFALSDPATHMTDNYYSQSSREVFIVTTEGRLYSVTHQAYYYPNTGGGNKLFWSTTESAGSTLFYSQFNSTQGQNQLFLYQNTQGGPSYVFCIATAASGDGNSATGLHVHFYPDSSSFSKACVATDLFFVPTS